MNRLGIVALVALVVLLIGSVRMVPGVVGVFHDDAIYLSSARSLAEGQGYRLPTVPGTPLQTKYPVGYPAALAVVWLAWPDFPANVVAMQWLTLVAAAAAYATIAFVLIRFAYCSALASLLIVLICATAVFPGYVSVILLSEMPFALAVALAIWRLEDEGAGQTRRAGTASVVTGLIIAAPMMIRTPGVAVLFGALAWLGWRRKLTATTAVVGILVGGSWLAWAAVAGVAWQQDATTGYYTDYVGAWQYLASAQLGTVVTINAGLIGYATLALPMEALAQVAVLWLGLGSLPIGLAVLALLAHGSWRLRDRAATAVALPYLALILLWPWPPQRFLIPLLPVLVMIAATGVMGIVTGGRLRSIVRYAGVGLAVVGLTLNLWTTARVVRLNSATGYPHINAQIPATDWSDYERLFQWIQENTAEDDILAGALDTMLSAYTGRPAIRAYVHRPDRLFYGAPGPPTGDPESLRRLLDRSGARYLVKLPAPWFAEERSFEELLDRTTADANVYRLRYSSRGGRFSVFEVIR